MSEIHPNNNDVILDGQNPPPVDAVVLGGEIGRKQRLQHEKAIARENKFWRNFPYLDGLPNGKDISPVLSVYPDLEILHIRSSGRHNALYFSEWRHEKLKALRIESSGLNRSAITSLCQLELPALEYLELWTGSDEYGSDSTIDDIMPIIAGDVFPHLRYLGVKNCEYTNEVASILAKSPLLEQLIELDLSMGTLTNDGLFRLLQSPTINELDKLNINDNFIRTNREIEQFNIKPNLIVFGTTRGSSRERYCSIRE
jgi:hypothetical protein